VDVKQAPGAAGWVFDGAGEEEEDFTTEGQRTQRKREKGKRVRGRSRRAERDRD